MSDFVKELREVINRHSSENGSNTPDFILSGFLEDCLNAFDCAVKQRESWYGRKTPEEMGSAGLHHTTPPLVCSVCGSTGDTLNKVSIICSRCAS